MIIPTCTAPADMVLYSTSVNNTTVSFNDDILDENPTVSRSLEYSDYLME
jgi:hypothetical protein